MSTSSSVGGGVSDKQPEPVQQLLTGNAVGCWHALTHLLTRRCFTVTPTLPHWCCFTDASSHCVESEREIGRVMGPWRGGVWQSTWIALYKETRYNDGFAKDGVQLSIVKRWRGRRGDLCRTVKGRAQSAVEVEWYDTALHSVERERRKQRRKQQAMSVLWTVAACQGSWLRGKSGTADKSGGRTHIE